MRILFVRFGYNIPDVVGGISSNTKSLVQNLKKYGVVSASVSRLSPYKPSGVYNRLLRKIYPPSISWADHFANHATYRYWDPLHDVGTAAAAFRSDIIVVQGGAEYRTLKACMKLGLPVVWYVHDLDFRPPAEPVPLDARLSVIACGQFVADRLFAETGHRADIIRPLIEPSDYRVTSSRLEVLMINPRVPKGVDMAWALAKARPDIPFRFIQAWHENPGEHAALVQRAQQFGNVTIQRSQSNMRPIYGRTKILLAPSHSEGFGRSVAEAQVSGIPALSSDRGGLTEAVGSGGVVLPLEVGPEPWIAALSKLWDDKTHYRVMSEAAFDYASRTELKPEQIAQDFLSHIQRRLRT